MKKIFISIIIIILFTGLSANARDAIYQYGKIIDDMDSAEVHQEQNDLSDILGTVNKGEYFLIISIKDGWASIITLTNMKGYIHDISVNVKGKSCGIGTVSTDDTLHTGLYMAPSFGSPRSDVVTDGDMVIVISYASDVGFDEMDIIVTRFGTRGYINSRYVNTTFPKE
jgi:hypothetical protein